MSGLESNYKPTFKIAKEEVIAEPLKAVPLTLRKQAVDNFDREFRIEEKAKLELKNDDPQFEFISNARKLFNQGEYALAHDIYNTVLKINPHHQTAIREMAVCAQQLRQHEESLRILQSLVDEEPSGRNYKLLGDQLFSMDYNEDALKAYLCAIQKNDLAESDLFDALKNSGNIMLKVGDAAAAEEYYNKAFTIQPDSDVLIVNFGSLAMYRGELDVALIRFREAVQINPRNDKAWVGLAMIHRQYGDSDLAWANIEKAMDVNPANTSAVRLVTEWAMKDNEIERSIRLVENYVQVTPGDAQILMWLSKLYYFVGQLKLARTSIENAIRLDAELDGGQEVLKVIIEEQALQEAR